MCGTSKTTEMTIHYCDFHGNVKSFWSSIPSLEWKRTLILPQQSGCTRALKVLFVNTHLNKGREDVR